MTTILYRQFQFRVGRENFCSIHVSLVPQPRSTGEHKTKPTQASVREIRGLGISPDIIVCRSEKPIDETVKEKISLFCHVDPQKVINIHDCPTIYHVPLVLRQQGLVELLNERLCLGMRVPKRFMKNWRSLADRAEHLRKVMIGNSIRLSCKFIRTFRTWKLLWSANTPSWRMPTPQLSRPFNMQVSPLITVSN